MKKILVTCFALCAIFVQSFATPLSQLFTTSTTVSYFLSFEKLVINDDFNVILQEGTAKEFVVSGNEKDIDKLQWTIKNGTLTLGVKNGTLKEKITLLVTVGSLKEIEVNSYASLTNIGNLSNPLRVQVNNSCNIALSSLHPIVIAGVAASEIEFKKKSNNIIIQ